MINSEGDYIIEDEAVRAGGYSGDKTIAFSESGKTIGILLDNEEPKKNRAFAWDAYNGKPLMASPLYLTSGTNEIKVTDETFTVITYSQLHVTHDFSGAIIEDTRFNKLYKEDNFCYIGFSLDDLPIDQLNYLLSSLNKLMPTIEFEKASKSHRDDIKEIKNTILRMLGEPVMGESEIGETAIKETSLTLSIHGNLYDRINHHVSTGLYGNDAETVAITLLTHALDCVPIRNIFKD